MAKICASSSTPKESLLSARSTFRRSESPPALHRAARASTGSKVGRGARIFIGWAAYSVIFHPAKPISKNFDIGIAGPKARKPWLCDYLSLPQWAPLGENGRLFRPPVAQAARRRFSDAQPS